MKPQHTDQMLWMLAFLFGFAALAMLSLAWWHGDDFAPILMLLIGTLLYLSFRE